MCAAAGGGNVAIMERLAAAGVPIMPATPGQTSPLHWTRDEHCIRWLLDRGVAIDARTADGATALASACRANDAPLVALLLGLGADPEAVPPEDRALLSRSSVKRR